MNQKIELYIGLSAILMFGFCGSNYFPSAPWASPIFRSTGEYRNDLQVGENIAAWRPEDEDHAWERSGFFEGDIVLPRGRNAVTDQAQLWPGGEVPYRFDTLSLDRREITAILRAMSEISRASCVRFRPKTHSDRSYLVISAAKSGCFSFVGRQGGPQLLNLQKGGCFYKGAPTHELMHALGFYHQHKVANRDNYITINWENVEPSHFRDFLMLAKDEFVDLGIPYDLRSIMHYSSRVFSKNGKPTLVMKATNQTMPLRTRLSQFDALKLNRMYKCSIPTPGNYFGHFGAAAAELFQ